ncbi:hypothetical protein D3C74_398740 [compost metagenome]
MLFTHDPGPKTLQLLILILLWGIAKLPWRVLVLTLLSLSLFIASTMIYQAILLSEPADVLIQWGPLHDSIRG